MIIIYLKHKSYPFFIALHGALAFSINMDREELQELTIAPELLVDLYASGFKNSNRSEFELALDCCKDSAQIQLYKSLCIKVFRKVLKHA